MTNKYQANKLKRKTKYEEHLSQFLVQFTSFEEKLEKKETQILKKKKKQNKQQQTLHNKLFFL